MENRIALIGIIVEDQEAVAMVNDLLHEYREWIVGRMGLPYRQREVSIISVVLDAPEDAISSLSGKLGMCSGVSVKSVMAKNRR
ncbi:MAG: iron-only hydrogenase system regulator [Clostridiales bacterium]|nr:iron-only hydrogenase system regulator [Clostridiales bacterium]